jgi:hypothetical protein
MQYQEDFDKKRINETVGQNMKQYTIPNEQNLSLMKAPFSR